VGLGTERCRVTEAARADWQAKCEDSERTRSSLAETQQRREEQHQSDVAALNERLQAQTDERHKSEQAVAELKGVQDGLQRSLDDASRYILFRLSLLPQTDPYPPQLPPAGLRLSWETRSPL
jgi:hypothetical protein